MRTVGAAIVVAKIFMAALIMGGMAAHILRADDSSSSNRVAGSSPSGTPAAAAITTQEQLDQARARWAKIQRDAHNNDSTDFRDILDLVNAEEEARALVEQLERQVNMERLSPESRIQTELQQVREELPKNEA